jgi:YHS domain-containing protein
LSNVNENAEVSPERPWLGLSSFNEQSSHYFFGREREINELLDRIRTQPLTVLFGLSGRGKSSLLGAGILPQLRAAGARPIILRLRQDGTSFVEQMRVAWDQATGAEPSSASLWERGHQKATRAMLLAEPPVLILDQFEEVFTLGQKRTAELEAFFREIACLIENRVPTDLRERLAEDDDFASSFDEQATPARIVITLREDFLAQLEGWKGMLPALMRNRMVLLPLSGPQAMDAVIRPGQLGSHPLVGARTAASIVRFVAQRDDDTPLEEIEAVPPLLSLLCFELNEARLATGEAEITATQLDEQKANILQNFYTRCFEGLPEAVRDVVESPLVVSESGHRNACTELDLAMALEAAGLERSLAETAISWLVNSRLLTQEHMGGIRRIELTHDLLTQLIVNSRKERRAQRELAETEKKHAAAREQTAKLLRERRRWQYATVAMAALVVGAVMVTLYARSAKRHAAESLKIAEKQTQTAQEAEKKSEANLVIASQQTQAAKQAQEESAKNLMRAEQKSLEAIKARTLATSNLKVAQQTIYEVLTTLESREANEVDGFHPIKTQLLARLAPLIHQFDSSQGKDESDGRFLRRVKLDLREANRLRGIGRQVESAEIYRAVFERIAALPEASAELRDSQFECLYRLDLMSHLLSPRGYDRQHWIKIGSDLFDKTRAFVGGLWRETYAQQIAEFLREQQQPERALKFLERAQASRNTAEGMRKVLPSKTNIALTDVVLTENVLTDNALSSEIVTTLKVLGRKKEAEAARVENTAKLAEQFRQFPQSPSLARHTLYKLFDQMYAAYSAKDESKHAKLADQIREIIARFKGSEELTFEAADAQLSARMARYLGWVSEDANGTMESARLAIKNYGKLYAGRTLELSSFDASSESMSVLTRAMDLVEQKTPKTELAAVRERHGQELVTLSAPFLDCARALGSDSECNVLTRVATKSATERLSSNPKFIADLLSQRSDVFRTAALAMIKRDQQEPANKPLVERASTEPLFDHCATERDYGRAVLGLSQARAALPVLSEAVKRCEPWAKEYDFDFYLRDSFSGLLVNLAKSQSETGNLAQARLTLARCADYEFFQCYEPYAQMLASGAGGPKDEGQAVALRARKFNRKRFTLPVQYKGGSALTFPFEVYIRELSDKRHYKGVEDQAIWLERNRGLIISQEVRNSFIKLEDIARENKVSFLDLVEYALDRTEPAESVEPEPKAMLVIADEVKSKGFSRNPAISSDASGVALGGFDPVSYFTQLKPAIGKAEYFSLWQGAIWFFDSISNKRLFDQSPEKYAPAFGGFCTPCMAQGHKVHGDPRYWHIYDNHLYLAMSKGLIESFQQKPEEILSAAQANWKSTSEASLEPSLQTTVGASLEKHLLEVSKLSPR